MLKDYPDETDKPLVIGAEPATESTAAAPLVYRSSPLRDYRKEISIFGLLLVVCVITAALNHVFVGAANLHNIAELTGLFGILSLGAAVVIVTGGIDLSVGSLVALHGVLLAYMLTYWHWPPVLAILAVMALATVIGLVHGLLITRLRLQPFIVTLCGLLIYRGLAHIVTNDNTPGFGDGTGFQWLINAATGDRLGVPIQFWILIVLSIIMWVLLHRTVLGRHLFAVGRNEDAARYSGIATERVITTSYVISGIFAGIAGILFAFYTNSISPSDQGQSYELYAIAAAVVGGFSLRGGEGSIIGVVIGTALLQVLKNVVNLLGLQSTLDAFVMGCVILIGVIVDEVIKRRGDRVAAK